MVAGRRNLIQSVLVGVALGLSMLTPVLGQIPPQEREALIAIYTATNGPAWTCGRNTNWLGPSGSEAEWSGVIVKGGHVTDLSLTGSGAEGAIPPEIGNLSHLRTLNLGIGFCGTFIFPFPTRLSLPPELGDLSELEELYLDRAGLEALPETLGNLSKLLRLNLHFNPLRELPASFGGLVSLEYLTLSSNWQLQIPTNSALYRLPNLKILDLWRTPFGELSASVAQLARLEELFLVETGLRSLPGSIGKLARLRSIRLDGNQLEELPVQIGDLKSLEELVLNKNQLRSLPDEIGGLTSLEKLLLKDNQLTALTEGISGLVALQTLDLRRNQLRSLPAGIGDLSNLSTLNLETNFLESLPPEIGQLHRLKHLLAGSNSITELPDWVAQLQSLTRIDLHSNRLTGFPEGLAGLRSLTSLSVADNKIFGPLPKWLGGIASLEGLAFQGNRIQGEVPPEIIGAILKPVGLDLRWNALFTDRNYLIDWINTKTGAKYAWVDKPLFGGSQTVAPTDVQIGRVTGTTVRLTWTPIEFSEFDGGYEVFVTTSPDGPLTRFGRTTDKNAASMVIFGLSPSTTYYFAIRTITEPHPDNANQVISQLSNLVAATTTPFVSTFFPALGVDDGFVGVAVSNPHDETVRLRFRAFDETGSELASELGEVMLGPGEQFARLSREIFEEAPGQTGWIEVSASSSRLGRLFQLGSADQLDGGLPSSFPLQKRFYFSRAASASPTFGGLDATFYVTIVNPTLESIEVELVLTTDRRLVPAGFRTYKANRSLPPRGALRETVADLFGQHDFRDGYIRVDVTEGEGAIGFVTAKLDPPGTLVGLQPLTAAAGPFFSAQLVSGGGLFTSLKLINVSGRIRNVTVTALAEDGSLLAPARTLKLVPLATSFREVGLGSFLGFGPDLVVGSLRIETDGDGVLGDVLFGSPAMEYAAALPLQRQPFRHAVFSQIASTPKFYTGVAVFNPNDQPATVELEAFADTGISLGRATIELPAGARFSRLLRELLQTSGFSRGYVVLKSDVPVIAQQLFGDFDQALLSAVPPTVLDSTQP